MNGNEFKFCPHGYVIGRETCAKCLVVERDRWVERYKRLELAVFRRYTKLYPGYVWVDAECGVAKMAEEIRALKKKPELKPPPVESDPRYTERIAQIKGKLDRMFDPKEPRDYSLGLDEEEILLIANDPRVSEYAKLILMRKGAEACAIESRECPGEEVKWLRKIRDAALEYRNAVMRVCPACSMETPQEHVPCECQTLASLEREAEQRLLDALQQKGAEACGRDMGVPEVREGDGGLRGGGPGRTCGPRGARERGVPSGPGVDGPVLGVRKPGALIPSPDGPFWLSEEAMLLEPRDLYDPCIIGVARRGDTRCAVYDAGRLREALMKDGFDDEDSAQEWIDVNMAGSYVGTGTPFFVDDPWPRT